MTPISQLTPLGAIISLWRRCPQWFHRCKLEPTTVPWPIARFDPARGPVYVRNDVFIAAPPAAAFDVLTDAERWPEWYGNAPFVDTGGTRLTLASKFRWRTFGTTQQTEVTEFEPARTIAWLARGGGATTYHRWFLYPKDGGTDLVTEEIETGLPPSLGRLLMRPALNAAHQLWVESLKERVEQR